MVEDLVDHKPGPADAPQGCVFRSELGGVAATVAERLVHSRLVYVHLRFVYVHLGLVWLIMIPWTSALSSRHAV